MTHYQLVAQNKRRSWYVITGFVVVVTALGWLLVTAAGYDPALVVLVGIVSSFGSLLSYWFSDKIVLGISGARPATRKEFFDFYTVAENLAMSQQLPMPKLFVIDDTAMNAFATGRDPQHAVICATTGLLKKLSRPEVEGVIAHELAHVRNFDIRLMSLVSVLVGFVVLLADWMLRSVAWGRRDRDSDSKSGPILLIIALIAAVLTPIVAQLIQLAISRSREFVADADAVAMTKNPQGMITALENLGHDREPLEAANKATAHLYIVSPLNNLAKESRGLFANLFSTHPALSDRIAALRSLIQ
jgi:heat shock protein HtpX